MNIVANAGPVPVVVIGPNMVFGATHVVTPFSTVTLTLDGKPYVPAGSPDWVKYKDEKGVEHEAHASNFDIYMRTPLANDRLFANTYRTFPKEAQQAIAVMKVGDKIFVESRHRGATVQANVTAINDGLYLVSDYPALGESPNHPGDSASIVRDANGVFVGYVSYTVQDPGKDPTGSVIIIPGLSVALKDTTPVAPAPPAPPVAGTTPTGTPPPPVATGEVAPLLPPVTTDEAYNNGVKDGRAQVTSELKTALAPLRALLGL